MTDPYAKFKELSHVGRIAAMALGVVHPFGLSPGQLWDLFRRARIQRRRRAIPKSTCGNVLRELRAAGIAESGSRKGLTTALGTWTVFLTEEALRNKKLHRFQRAFVPDLPTYWSYDVGGARREMKLRNYTVAGRFDWIESEIGSVKADEWLWTMGPGAAHLLATLPPPYADDAVSAGFDLAGLTAAPAAPVLEAYTAGHVDRAPHAADAAYLHLLRGEAEEALAVFAALPGEEREGKAARTGLAATRAAVATLRGDDAGAARWIEEAVASEKAGTRRRNVFPGSGPFVLSLLSLIRDPTPENIARLEHLRSVAVKNEEYYPLLDAVVRAERARMGKGYFWEEGRISPVIDRLCEGLSGCWLGEFPEPDEDTHFGALVRFATVAAANGYRWLAGECLEVCGRWWTAAGRPEAELAEEIPPQVFAALSVSGGSLTAGEAAAEVRAELGTTTLASVVVPVPAWEHTLRGLEQVVYDVARKRPRTKKGPGPERRLVWILRFSETGYPTASALEQRRLKSGRWSKGQRVALKRLRQKAGTMDFLIDQDRVVAEKITEDPYRAGPAFHLPMAGIAALAGHPYVFDEERVPLEVVRRDPELLLEEEDGVLRAQVEPHLETALARNHDIGRTADGRVEVTSFSPAHKKVCRLIPAAGLEVPAEARDRVVEVASGLAVELRVQGVLGAGAPTAAEVEADPAPWVRLEPSGPGLSIALVVEPLPESATYFQPGVGGTTAFVTVDGRPVQARRDLAAEDRAAAGLVAACPALRAVGPDGTAVLSDPAECLELIDQLHEAGARCLWPKGEPFRVVARADAASLRLSVKSAADWFAVSGALKVNAERAVELRNLFELIDSSPSSRFVALGDGAFVSLTEDFRRQLEDLRSIAATPGKKQVRVHPLAALTLREFFESTRLTADAAWEARRRRFEEAGAAEPRVPGTLRAELRPYQEDGFAWLARLSRWGAGACLADDMGLGKTVQTLALLLDRARDGAALVVAPTSVVANWLDEARRFAPTLNIRAYTGPASARRGKLEGLEAFDVVVTTYGLLHNDVDALAAVEWSTVVLDEAQAIKNPATKRARAARRLPARFRIVTTGTPVQNNVVDLYSLFAFLNPGMLGSMRHFRKNFALPIERDRHPAARSRLRRLISPFVLRRIKSDVLDDLPPRTEVTLHVEMSPEEAELYEALRMRAVDDLEALARSEEDVPGAESKRLEVLAHLTRLRLACCNPRLVHADGPPSSKLRTFAETLDELRQGGHRVLVFSQFVRHLKLIEEHLTGAAVPYQYLDGSTPTKARTERIAAFQAGEGDAFLISLRAGGVGLNLTAADYVIHMDPWWNPAAEDQAADRAHRIGQTRPVTIYRLVTKGTIEEQIIELHRSKRELADRLLEGADAPAKLTTGELLDLLRG